jgi:hypothetical protein
MNFLPDCSHILVNQHYLVENLALKLNNCIVLKVEVKFHSFCKPKTEYEFVNKLCKNNSFQIFRLNSHIRKLKYVFLIVCIEFHLNFRKVFIDSSD